MSGPHTRVILQRNTQFQATADIVVQHTGQTIGWLRVYEIATFLRQLGAHVKLPEGYER